jgi:hypothetical protein
MGAFLFLCPNTGLQVQGWTESEDTENDGIYVMVTCAACRGAHWVNPKTGNIIGQNDDD